MLVTSVSSVFQFHPKHPTHPSSDKKARFEQSGQHSKQSNLNQSLEALIRVMPHGQLQFFVSPKCLHQLYIVWHLCNIFLPENLWYNHSRQKSALHHVATFTATSLA